MTVFQAKRNKNQTTINIDQPSEAELIDLQSVERLRFLSQMRAHSQMLDYKIGERVTFHPDGHPPLFGIVTRYNRRTVTVITDTGQHWKRGAKTAAPSRVARAEKHRQREGCSVEKRVNSTSLPFPSSATPIAAKRNQTSDCLA